MSLPFHIERAVGTVFRQLAQALTDLSDDDYRKSLEVLSGSSIGQHTRHILEFFKVLIGQYESGSVNYDNRERDQQLETDRETALKALSIIRSSILLEDKEMMLTGVYASHPDEVSVKTTYHRELIYNLEHAVHHMAMIKIGFRHLTNLSLPSEFGVAAATTLYRKSIL